MVKMKGIIMKNEKEEEEGLTVAFLKGCLGLRQVFVGPR